MPFYSEIKLALFPFFKIKKILNKSNPDYIHIATEGPLGFAARRFCIKHHKHFSSSYHTHFPHYVKIRIKTFFDLTYAYLRWFHNASKATMVATQSLKEALESKGFKHVVLWPLGVDIERFKAVKTLDTSSYPKPIFGYIGRIAIEKNVEEFLKCNLPGTKLVIGDGPMRKKLEKRYRNSATFLGYKKGKELVEWVSACDVIVFPSKTDTFGLVIVEALACGVPVAAHDVMGPRDIITHGTDGYLNENLTKAAQDCLILSKDVCREKAKQFSWDNSAQAFISNLVPTISQ
jgi:glycosyltransferase involved in cell wall biosynthesis